MAEKAAEEKAQPVVLTEEERLAKANEVVRNYAIGTAAFGVVPAPGIDLIGMTSVQLAMLHKLSTIYDVKFTKSLARNATAALVGGGIPFLSAATVASALKAVPFLGTYVAVLAQPALGGAVGYAVGKVFIQHFESGGTFLTFDPNKVRAYYEELLAEGGQKAQAA
jgi:uncharacterized protein (DUF697 family)|tara:strand:- start:1971 stop:2468 length:498 start_codon:yes stop_codon:yes gene_type:complete